MAAVDVSIRVTATAELVSQDGIPVPIASQVLKVFRQAVYGLADPRDPSAGGAPWTRGCGWRLREFLRAGSPCPWVLSSAMLSP